MKLTMDPRPKGEGGRGLSQSFSLKRFLFHLSVLVGFTLISACPKVHIDRECEWDWFITRTIALVVSTFLTALYHALRAYIRPRRKKKQQAYESNTYQWTPDQRGRGGGVWANLFHLSFVTGLFLSLNTYAREHWIFQNKETLETKYETQGNETKKSYFFSNFL